MYLYKIFIFSLFYSGLQVHGQYYPLEVTGSGDGLNENSTYSRLPLLDDNGEISTSVTDIDLIKNLEETEDNSTATTLVPTDSTAFFTDATLFSTETTIEETSVIPTINNTFTDITVAETLKTTFPTTNPQTADLGTTNTLVDSTTTSPITIRYTTETTTSADMASEEDDNTTMETVTSSTTLKTTKKPIKTDSATEAEGEYRTKPKDTTVRNSPTLAPASTVSMPGDAGKRCLFMDTGLTCDIEVVCYGDGEIDCSDDEDMDSEDPDSDDRFKGPLSNDDPDYVIEGKTSETFPIRRIDLFKMLFLTPTNNDVSSEEYKDVTPTTMPFLNFTMLASEGFLNEEYAEMNDTLNVNETENVQDSETTEEFNSFPEPMEPTKSLTHDDGILLSSIDNSSNTDITEGLEDTLLGNDEISTTNFPNASEVPFTFNETITYQEVINNDTSTETTLLNTEMTTSQILEEILSEGTTDKEVRKPTIFTRAKRDKNANNSHGSYMSNYKVSELESSKKKMKVKSCKLSGNLICFPHPTKLSCSGKTVCQVPPQAIETVEKPASQKGLEKWTIAVIVICAITATFTIALLIYLIFTSYKKLKVQPQNGVTTLNYVNSAQP